jgi:hypothetical protein
MSRLLENLRRDKEADEHDERVRKGDLFEDTHVLRDWKPCPMPDRCRWKAGTCMTCGKRAGPSNDTVMLNVLAAALEGGIPFAAGDLPFSVWVALGHVRAGASAGRELR